MGGFMGIGNSSAKTDRGVQLAGQKGLWNVFNWALPQGQAGEAAGKGTLDTALAGAGQAQGYWSRLMKAGRSDIASMSAPATNAITDQADAARRSAGEFGTGRTGGGTAQAREAGTQTQKNVADIVNQNLWGARSQGAQGVAQTAGLQAGIGGEQLTNASNLLGLGTGAVEDIMSNATQSRALSQEINMETQAQIGQAIGTAIQMGLAFA